MPNTSAMYGAENPPTPGRTTRTLGPISVTKVSRTCCSDLPACRMLAIRILAALQTGQMPFGGITQAIFKWQPQLHCSLPAILTTSSVSYSVAVCATHITVAIAIRRLAFHLRMFTCYSHYLGPWVDQPALARDHTD